ncbi:hypothetical protein LWC35_08975 [Pseudonocardia kujensis]|uniref:hypothetical protein n=1 Tax=Pseudonocardia kujensis TaxID=1128675 RepID=UPI001E44BA77|nr:hypothetical protein [Pseudonocardia kujensis]MCE0763045.1 hypothetical protein [Pseudonocardia kujensis]
MTSDEQCVAHPCVGVAPAVVITFSVEAPGLTRRLAVDLGRTSTATCRRGPRSA